MSKAVFIGVLSYGTTSKSQADWLREITPDFEWQGIDTDGSFLSQPRWSRSLAFRLRIGPAVSAVNRFILQSLPTTQVDLVWIGKGVLLYPSTVRRIRERTKLLIHYTPDTAFYGNRSRLFSRTMKSYDLLITTKSFEIENYHRCVDPQKVFLTTQGYDPRIHYPRSQNKKKKEAVLIGLCEPNREDCVSTLRRHNIPVVIGGKGWEKVVRRHGGEEGFRFLGASVFGNIYAQAISEATIGLGLMSQKFPEVHTTRTMEIPACGTILATQKTPETGRFYDDHEALFFDDFEDLSRKIIDIFRDPSRADSLAKAGYEAVLRQPFSYPQIMAECLKRVGIETTVPKIHYPPIKHHLEKPFPFGAP